MPAQAARVAAGIVSVLVLSGIVYAAFNGVPTATVSTARGISITSFEPGLNVTPGHAVAFPIHIGNFLQGTQNITLRFDPEGGPFTASPLPVSVPKGGASVWYTVNVAGNAALGAYRPLVKADVPGSIEGLYFTGVEIDVISSSGSAATLGQNVTLRWTGLLQNRTLWDGDQSFTESSTFSRMAGNFVPRAAETDWTLGCATATYALPGITPYLVGMVPGEAREIHIPAWQVFGNKTINSTFERTQTVPLTIHARPGLTQLSYDNWSKWLSDTRQSPAASFTLGDTFTFYLISPEVSGLLPVPVKILSIGVSNNANVTWRFPDVGAKFSLFTQFPNASRIVSENATTWVVHTAPQVAPLTNFTWASYWPNESQITSCSPSCGPEYAAADFVNITQSPPVGSHFEYLYNNYPVSMNVTAEDSHFIGVQFENPHPYAGIDIDYEVILDAVHRPG